MTEREQPPVDSEEENHKGAEIIDFSEIQAAAKSEQEQPDLESEKNRLEARVLEVCSTIETRARSMSERLQTAYGKIDSSDIEELKKTATKNHQEFFKVIDQDRAAFLECVSQASSADDIKQIEQNLEIDMLAGSIANLDNAEVHLQEVEMLAESQAGNNLVDRFFGTQGTEGPTEEELAAMPEFVRNEVMHQMKRLDQEAPSFEDETEKKISSLEIRYQAVKERIKEQSPVKFQSMELDTFRQVEEGFDSLKRILETLKSLPEGQKRGLEAQEIRVNIDRMLENLDTLSARWG